MNNIHEFKNLFIEFETETKKRAKEKYATLDECITKLKTQGYNPYVKESTFISFCRKLRNVDFHNKNDNYYFITTETITKLKEIVEEVKHPHKVLEKATTDIYSKNINDKVLPTMKKMNKESYTHIPIYNNNNNILEGVFSENTLFKYIIDNKKIEINEDTTFNDIKECISLDKSDEIVIFVPKNKLYDDVVNDFIKKYKDGNKLSCVMITNNGTSKEKVQGIITSWDVIGS